MRWVNIRKKKKKSKNTTCFNKLSINNCVHLRKHNERIALQCFIKSFRYLCGDEFVCCCIQRLLVSLSMREKKTFPSIL